MIDERYIELMSSEIDGVNTPAESDELRRHLAENLDAQRYYLELRKSVGLLENAGEISPPGEMPRNIMDLIDKRHPGEAGDAIRDPRPAIAVVKPFRSYLKPGYAWSFAAGLAAGLLIFAAARVIMVENLTADRNQFYAEMSFDDQSGTELVGSPWQLDHDEFSGTVILRLLENRLFARITGYSDADIQFEFHHEQAVRCRGCQMLAGPEFRLVTAATRTSFAYKGTGSYLLVFAAEPNLTGPISLQVVVAGAVLAEREFNLAPS